MQAKRHAKVVKRRKAATQRKAATAKKPFDWRSFKATDYIAKEEPSDHGRHRRP
jgi:hypothetical protein